MNMGLFDDGEAFQLFETGETLDYGDVAERLGIDLQTAVVICDRLERQGIIEVVYEDEDEDIEDDMDLRFGKVVMAAV